MDDLTIGTDHTCAYLSASEMLCFLFFFLFFLIVIYVLAFCHVDIDVKVNNEPVEVVSNFKYLGTLIDNKLSFSDNSNLI